MFRQFFPGPGIGAVPQPEQSVEPKAGGVTRVEKIEMPNLRKSEIFRRQQHFFHLCVAIMGETAPDGVDGRNLVIGDGEAQDWRMKFSKGFEAPALSVAGG